MALTVSNNGAVAAASYYLGKNQDALFNKMASCEPMEIVQTF